MTFFIFLLACCAAAAIYNVQQRAKLAIDAARKKTLFRR